MGPIRAARKRPYCPRRYKLQNKCNTNPHAALCMGACLADLKAECRHALNNFYSDVSLVGKGRLSSTGLERETD